MTLIQFIKYFKSPVGKPLMILLFLLVFTSCKKEYQDSPYAEMINFSIKDAKGEILKAGLENQEIILYWPPEQAVPEFITPSITLAEGATVLPASGTKVPFRNGEVFRVKAKNGNTTTYKLKLKINAIIPYISNVNFMKFKTKIFLTKGSPVSIIGDYFGTDAKLIKLYLIGKDDKETQVEPVSVNPISISFIPDGTPGLYKRIKLVSQELTAIYEQEFELIPEQVLPALTTLSFGQPRTLKHGDEIEVKGGMNLAVVDRVIFYNNATGGEYDLIIKEKRADGWILQIPPTLPPGVYNDLYFFFPETDYREGGNAGISFTGSITIVP